ncbi:hypothetical protein H8A95_15780 [Bradyrhizobium sp. Pear76]|uniref:hypothetical protein n=1 Tax=Bradyrhizobium oropedii TaxID=1571201 RepID=UPI001E4840F3|nr:hypothetical protein [Bradyrhizobium oropedii]MCC8963730.1 hypothetical protein [Bradyrhizobium oropedii]
MIRQLLINGSTALSQRFVRCAVFWSDVAEALNQREPLSRVRKRNGQDAGRVDR